MLERSLSFCFLGLYEDAKENLENTKDLSRLRNPSKPGKQAVGVLGGILLFSPTVWVRSGGERRDTQEHTGTQTGTYTRMLYLPFSDLRLKNAPINKNARSLRYSRIKPGNRCRTDANATPEEGEGEADLSVRSVEQDQTGYLQKGYHLDHRYPFMKTPFALCRFTTLWILVHCPNDAGISHRT